MREVRRREMGRIFIGALLFVLSLFPFEKLLSIRFLNPDLDFVFVLAVLFLPGFLRTLSAAFLLSALFRLANLSLLPRRIVEKKLYGLKKSSWKRSAFYASVISLILLFPLRSGVNIGSFFGSYGRFLPFDALLLLESLVLGGFLFHTFKLFLVSSTSFRVRARKKVVSEAREEEIEIQSLPLIPVPVLRNARFMRESGFPERELMYRAPSTTGYYRFDILEFRVFTFPFFFSRIFRLASGDLEFIVLPEVKRKGELYIKNPYIARETGELVKKVSGSSLEFAGIRSYSPGDPPSRIHWRSLARFGKLMTMDFYSHAEDRWILVLDMRERDQNILRFTTAFAQIFARRDVEIAIEVISGGVFFMNYTKNARELLSFIVKRMESHANLSEEGAREIISELFNPEEVSKRCRRSGISLSSFLFYCGYLRGGEESVADVREAALELLRKLGKSGKMLVVTPYMSSSEAEEIARVARIRKCRLLFASYEKIPGFYTFILPRENPEKVVWRLMYV